MNMKNFEDFINENHPINEGIMSLSAYYKDWDKEIKAPAKKIDDLLNSEIKSDSVKNAILDLITDLVDEYAIAYSDSQQQNGYR